MNTNCFSRIQGDIQKIIQALNGKDPLMITVNDKQQLVKKLFQGKKRIVELERKLKENEELLLGYKKSNEERQVYFNKMRRGLLVLDDQGIVIDINPAACHLFQQKKTVVINHLWPWKGLSFMKENGVCFRDDELPWHHTSQIPMKTSMEMGIYSKKQLLFWADVQVEPAFNLINGMFLFFDDRTRYKETELRLKQSEKKYRAIFENIQDIYFEISMDARIQEISPSIRKLGRINPKSLIGCSLDDLFFDHKERIRIFDLIMAEGQIEDEIVKVQWKKSKSHACSIMASLIRDIDGKPLKIVGSLRDITRRINAEEQLQRDLEEKKILLREIHHRVKNNMAIITSLLNLQSNVYSQPEVIGIFHDLKNRIISMSLVHEHLYRSDHLSAIQMMDYLKSLTQMIMQSYQSNNQSVKALYEIGPVSLKISSALYCGLIVNELVSNAMKHAFIRKKSNRMIKVKMNQKGTVILLEVIDNGIGISPDFNWEKTQSLGLKLVHLLSRQQLKGNVQIKRENGSHFIIRFDRGD
ncbi:histidine kinase dimerization/phosphoacceptor domain -containing protein [bacterium]